MSEKHLYRCIYMSPAAAQWYSIFLYINIITMCLEPMIKPLLTCKASSVAKQTFQGNKD